MFVEQEKQFDNFCLLICNDLKWLNEVVKNSTFFCLVNARNSLRLSSFATCFSADIQTVRHLQLR